MTKKRPKYKIGQKVIFRHSLNNIIYRIYAINIYKGWRIWYNINFDTTYEVVDEYQIKKYRPTNIWLQTKE